MVVYKLDVDGAFTRNPRRGEIQAAVGTLTREQKFLEVRIQILN